MPRAVEATALVVRLKSVLKIGVGVRYGLGGHRFYVYPIGMGCGAQVKRCAPYAPVDELRTGLITMRRFLKWVRATFDKA